MYMQNSNPSPSIESFSSTPAMAFAVAVAAIFYLRVDECDQSVVYDVVIVVIMQYTCPDQQTGALKQTAAKNFARKASGQPPNPTIAP
jgi:hypothetical protein